MKLLFSITDIDLINIKIVAEKRQAKLH